MVREVVVVLDGLERGGLAVQAEVVYGDGFGEEVLDCWRSHYVLVCILE